MIFTDSLRKNSDFQAVYKSGKSYANKYLVIYTSKNGTDRNRLGISVSKKVGNSVVRHRIKRLVKESYRLHELMFNSGLDIAVIARQGSDACDYASIESALLHLMKLNGTLDNSLKG
jgi:ribonuclease P protein component